MTQTSGIEPIKSIEGTEHQSLDLFAAAQQWSERPRFHLPLKDSPDTTYQTVYWKDYARDTEKLANFLTSIVPIGGKVAMLGQTSYPWIVAYSAIQTVRGVVVPIYLASKGDLIGYFLEHSESTALCCDLAFLDTLRPLSLAQVAQIIVLDANTEQLPKDFPIPLTAYAEALAHTPQTSDMGKARLAEAQSSDLATIIYTSGTTGLPKGVMLSHANLAASSTDWIQLNGPHIPEQAVDLHWLPLSHAFGIGAIMLGNKLGWQSYFASPKNVMDTFDHIKPHTFLSVPAYWEKLYLKVQEHGGHQAAFDQVTGGRLCFGLSGGAGLKKEIKQGFYDLGLLLIEGYGLTECSPTLTMNRYDRFNFDSVGVPYPSVEIKLAEDGEILAKGPNVFVGYYKNEAATQETFDPEGWFKTGDVGRWTEDGFLQIIDRKKEILVTSGGKNIPPQNIERCFQDNPYIQHLIVYGDGKKYLTAMATLEEVAVRKTLADHQTPWEQLVNSETVKTLIDTQIQQVNNELASFETLKKVWINPQPLSIEDDLLTSSLKPRRKAIYTRYAEPLEALYR